MILTTADNHPESEHQVQVPTLGRNIWLQPRRRPLSRVLRDPKPCRRDRGPTRGEVGPSNSNKGAEAMTTTEHLRELYQEFEKSDGHSNEHAWAAIQIAEHAPAMLAVIEAAEAYASRGNHSGHDHEGGRMNITISEPTPAPEMPVIYAMASVIELEDGNMWVVEGSSNREFWEIRTRETPGSRLIKIDPNAPSFEPGPTEWVGSDKTKYSFDPTRPEWIDMMFDGEAPTTLCPNTRTDIGRVISALMTKWHEAKEGT